MRKFLLSVGFNILLFLQLLGQNKEDCEDIFKSINDVVNNKKNNDFDAATALMQSLNFCIRIYRPNDLVFKRQTEILNDSLLNAINRLIKQERKATELAKTEKERALSEKNLKEQALIKAKAESDSANRQKKRAEIAEKNAIALKDSAIVERNKAIKEANKSKALYLLSDAERMSPLQGLRLINEGYNYALKIKDDTAIRYMIEEKIIDFFNENRIYYMFMGISNSIFTEKLLFEKEALNKKNEISISFSSNSKDLSLLTVDQICYYFSLDNLKQLRSTSESFGWGTDFLGSFIRESPYHLMRENKKNKIARFINKHGFSEILFSKDGKWIGLSTNNVIGLGSRRLYSIYKYKDEKLVSFLPKFIAAEVIEFSTDNRWLTVYYKSDSIKVYDLIKEEEAYFSKNTSINDIVYSNNNLWVITNSKKANILIPLFGDVNYKLIIKSSRNNFSPDSQWLIYDSFLIINLISLKENISILVEHEDKKFEEIIMFIKNNDDKILPLSTTNKKKYELK